jgi:serine/threonine-protein kinase HipA
MSWKFCFLLIELVRNAARKLQTDPEHGFTGNAVVEKISALIEQRCALTIRRLTNPVAENNAVAEPPV